MPLAVLPAPLIAHPLLRLLPPSLLRLLPMRAIAADEAPAGSATMPRVTGTAVLLPQQKEEPGFGLYSYALLTHAPHGG